MRIIYSSLLWVMIIVAISACKKPYMPEVITTAPDYLVVDGMINLTDTIKITLSRTVNITSASAFKPELKAIVAIENDKGNSYPLTENGNGSYVTVPLNLSGTNMYRLRITTANHTIYVSDFVAAKVTPPIDSLIMRISDDGIHFSVNTHDATNNARYYRWEYAETWEFNSYARSDFMYDQATKSVIARTAQVHHCWGNFNSTDIVNIYRNAG